MLGSTSRNAVRPNPSLNRTRYGSRRKPGLQCVSYSRSPGLRRLPPRAGQLKRYAVGSMR